MEGETMRNSTSNPIEALLYRRERRRQEQAARVIPYVSFLLTHLALALFLVTLFFVDPLLRDPAVRNIVKGSLIGCAILALALEWGYAILCSRRWKCDILTLERVHAQQNQAKEDERRRELEIALIQEQQRRRNLLFDLHMRNRQMRVEPPQSPDAMPLPLPSQPQSSPTSP